MDAFAHLPNHVRNAACVAVDHFNATYSGVQGEHVWADFKAPEDASSFSAFALLRGWSARPSRLFPERNRVLVRLA